MIISAQFTSHQSLEKKTIASLTLHSVQQSEKYFSDDTIITTKHQSIEKKTIAIFTIPFLQHIISTSIFVKQKNYIIVNSVKVMRPRQRPLLSFTVRLFTIATMHLKRHFCETLWIVFNNAKTHIETKTTTAIAHFSRISQNVAFHLFNVLGI